MPNDHSDIAVHPNGFLQIRAGESFRIHVWSADIPRQEVPTPIHNHRWGFTSVVVLGTMVNVRYRVEPAAPGVGTHHKATINRNEAGVQIVDRAAVYQVVVDRIEYVKSGESYSMLAGEYHESRPHGFCVTACSMTEKDPAVETTIMVPVGFEPDNDFNFNPEYGR